MDMQHIIINWLSLCSEFAIFSSVFIVPNRPRKVNLLKELPQCGMIQFNTNKKFVKSFFKKFSIFFSDDEIIKFTIARETIYLVPKTRVIKVWKHPALGGTFSMEHRGKAMSKG
jgi:hypothetical protein